MEIDSILTPELTFCNLHSLTKKSILQASSELIAEKMPLVKANEIYEALLAREQLGSTGLGNGIAIPHCRVAKCHVTVGCLIKLETGINFEAIDNNPVDLLFFLLVPEDIVEGHLEVLRTLAEHFNNPEYCSKLRTCEDAASLFKAASTK